MEVSLSNLLLVFSPSWPADGTVLFPSLASFAFFYSVPSPCPPPLLTWQMLVTRLDAVESLNMTSCLVKGTKEGRKQVFIASGFIATVLFSLLMHLLEKGFFVRSRFSILLRQVYISIHAVWHPGRLLCSVR